MYNVEKYIPKKTPPSFRHKVDQRGDTNENTCGQDDSPSETDDCVGNVYKEHDNEEDEEFKVDASVINNTKK